MIRMKLFDRVDEQSDILSVTKDCSIYIAYQDDTALGYCLFGYEGDSVVLYNLKTEPLDLSLEDGLVRASIAAAETRMKTKVIVKNIEDFNGFMTSVGVFKDNEAVIDDIFGTTECGGTND